MRPGGAPFSDFMQKDLVRAGRLSGVRTRDIETFLSSMDADRHIADADILVDIAHLTMLADQGIVGPEYAGPLMRSLLSLYEKGVPAEAFDSCHEDIHAGIEAFLTREAGQEAGGRLHIGRSRNDEVATCLRVRTRADLLGQMKALTGLRKILLTLAATHTGSVMPGFTHLQHAQPTTLAHHLLAYEQVFSRDYGRLYDAYARLNQSPLGSAAFATTGYPIDREQTAGYLGFDGLVLNTMDAVASRDVFIEVLAADTLLLMSISRFCEELVLWSSLFVRFVDLDEIYCSTSSIMPQKKNPDVAEILRSRAGTLLGRLVSAVTIMKGLPMSYNRDMQDLNPHLWEGICDVRRDIDLLAGMLETASFDLHRMEEEAGCGFSTATELADTLVRRYGIAFRTAHHIVGRAVRNRSLDLTTLDAAAEQFLGKSLSSLGVTEADIRDALSVQTGIAVRNHPGGPAPDAALDAIRQQEHLLTGDLTRLTDLIAHLDKATEKLFTDAKRIAAL